ncbi:MAG: hypothetical protein H6607_00275 [Flavobacteriales bacterium]|nr:hypothetical protein [Flavobacteriales bacterium]
MNRLNVQFKNVLLTCSLIFIRSICFSQDTAKFNIITDTTWTIENTINISISSTCFDYSVYHLPSKEDSTFCQNYSALITAEPTEGNHSNYFLLACSLWQLSRLNEAEKMFLKIVGSAEPYYVGTYYNNSDIPDDTSNNIYGYGSYTWHYKNYACRYLSKIYIEEKRFESALTYLHDADKKYIVEQNCGTGHLFYRHEMDGLYGLVYEGLEL